MKVIVLILVVFVYISCESESSNANNPNEGEHPFAGEWQLIKVVSAWTGEEQEIPRKQSYIFSSDGSFIKRSGKEEGSGTYALSTERNDKFLTLTFLKNKSLSESCSSGTESFRWESDDLIVGGSAPCDGPFLHYRRLE